jgi:hypothetical protein
VPLWTLPEREVGAYCEDSGARPVVRDRPILHYFFN